MSKDLEEWVEDFKRTPEYVADSFEWTDMAKKAWKAGRTLGRREMKGEAKAWLITGSGAFEDAVVLREKTADDRLKTRGNDGSRKVPLYAIEAIPEEVDK